ncbi:hypothetical protein BSIN_1411 [Burkholderia singularis]|uniref:Uncharacterized protein n=1 Tax=Burkholderia singularis TaxID=1503053 RepID=A0A238GYQ6_9BURK|nr:hypothetical protein BSIN_1411 [Burkholderia singularis]
MGQELSAQHRLCPLFTLPKQTFRRRYTSVALDAQPSAA